MTNSTNKLINIEKTSKGELYTWSGRSYKNKSYWWISMNYDSKSKKYFVYVTSKETRGEFEYTVDSFLFHFKKWNSAMKKAYKNVIVYSNFFE